MILNNQKGTGCCKEKQNFLLDNDRCRVLFLPLLQLKIEADAEWHQPWTQWGTLVQYNTRQEIILIINLFSKSGWRLIKSAKYCLKRTITNFVDPWKMLFYEPTIKKKCIKLKQTIKQIDYLHVCFTECTILIKDLLKFAKHIMQNIPAKYTTYWPSNYYSFILAK